MNWKLMAESVYRLGIKVVKVFFSAEFLITLMSLIALALTLYIAFITVMHWSTRLEVRDTKDSRKIRVKPACAWRWHTEDEAA